MSKRNSYTSNSDKGKKIEGGNNSPLHFAGKILLLLLCIFLIFNLILPVYSVGYMGALQDKAQRLSSIREPKIVLIGNSNLAYGIHSELIEQEFGMPVVNMGLHGGLGNAFHEQIAIQNVTEGDIYIICHNDFGDDDTIEDAVLAWTALENHYELWSALRPKDALLMLKGFPIYLKKALFRYSSKTEDTVDYEIVRASFNSYGDVAVLREGQVTFDYSGQAMPTISDAAVRRINKLNAYLQKKGATLLVAGYPILVNENTGSVEEYLAFQEELTERLDPEFISDYEDYRYEDSYFYNSILHMTTEGARLRTCQLMEDLKKWQELQ